MGARVEKKLLARHEDQWLLDYHKSVSASYSGRGGVFFYWRAKSTPSLTFTASFYFRRENPSLLRWNALKTIGTAAYNVISALKWHCNIFLRETCDGKGKRRERKEDNDEIL